MIYLCRNKRNGYVKIGFSHTPDLREKTLQSEEPELFFEHVFTGDLRAEEALHRKYAHRRLRGEWFELTPDDVGEIIKAAPINGINDPVVIEVGCTTDQLINAIVHAVTALARDMVNGLDEESRSNVIELLKEDGPRAFCLILRQEAIINRSMATEDERLRIRQALLVAIDEIAPDAIPF